MIADADDYDGKRVQVRAFATVGYEHAFLFSTACEGDDKRVWFQVSTDGDDDARDRSVRSLRRAFRHRNPSELVVYGRFEAPPKYTPRPGTPPGIAKLEKGSLGYGHMSAYRFRFTIERVVEERR